MQKELRAKLVIGGSVLAVLVACGGLWSAIRSPLFTLRVVEVEDQPGGAPVDADTLSRLADAPVGKENLFTLDLQDIEARLRTHPWIREVYLQKRFPQTLSIQVEFRQPAAVLQGKSGELSYVDSNGFVFGEVNLAQAADLPILAGFGSEEEGAPEVGDALKLLSTWAQAEVGKLAQVASISWDEERGYRVLVTYQLAARKAGGVLSRGRARAMVELGQDFDGELDTQLSRLHEVFTHLARSGTSARQIWADAGKKIVVKITHGS